MHSTKIVWIALDLKSFKGYLLNHWSKFKYFHRIVSRDSLYQNCTNGSAQMDKRIAKAAEKKYILTTSPPEPLVHIQNNFTEFFLMMPSTKLHKWFQSAEQKDRQSSR